MPEIREYPTGPNETLPGITLDDTENRGVLLRVGSETVVLYLVRAVSPECLDENGKPRMLAPTGLHHGVLTTRIEISREAAEAIRDLLNAKLDTPQTL